MMIERTTFSPRKLRISILLDVLEPGALSQATLMGKCAYTIFILYSYPCLTPVIMLAMWLQMVRTAASSFLAPNHFSTLMTSSPLAFLHFFISTDECLNERSRVPRFPVTLTSR